MTPPDSARLAEIERIHLHFCNPATRPSCPNCEEIAIARRFEAEKCPDKKMHDGTWLRPKDYIGLKERAERAETGQKEALANRNRCHETNKRLAQEVHDLTISLEHENASHCKARAEADALKSDLARLRGAIEEDHRHDLNHSHSSRGLAHCPSSACAALAGDLPKAGPIRYPAKPSESGARYYTVRGLDEEGRVKTTLWSGWLMGIKPDVLPHEPKPPAPCPGVQESYIIRYGPPIHCPACPSKGV